MYLQDADKLIGGYVLVFVYVNIMLSKLNFVEQRVWLSVIGILSVFMGMILGYGLCSLCGLFYSAAHTIIPFLLLGIGIDNIFVITQTFNTLGRILFKINFVVDYFYCRGVFRACNFSKAVRSDHEARRGCGVGNHLH